MLVIRLARYGAKKKPFYRIVVMDQRIKREGRCIERLGFYSPVAQGQSIPLDFNLERATHWIGQGAQPSDTVKRLMNMQKKINKATAKTEAKPAAKAKTEAKPAAKAKAEAKPAAKPKAEAKPAAKAQAEAKPAAKAKTAEKKESKASDKTKA